MNNNYHNFHLVMNNNLKNKIIKFSKELKLSRSDTVVLILNNTLCVLNKYQFNLEEKSENLDYQTINWDTDFHIYLDKKLYRKIKHLADTIFSFSIAIVIRKLIELYFKILEKSKGRIEKVEKIFKRFYMIHVKKYGSTLKQWKKEIKNEQLFGKFYYYLAFNDKFTITGFKFNNTF